MLSSRGRALQASLLRCAGRVAETALPLINQKFMNVSMQGLSLTEQL